MQLLEDKRCAYRAHLDNPKSTAKKDVIRNINSTIQLKLHQIQDSWLRNKADKIQSFADKNDMKNFYDGLDEVNGPITSGSSPLLSADGITLITDKEKILERSAVSTLTAHRIIPPPLMTKPSAGYLRFLLMDAALYQPLKRYGKRSIC